jgi:hypothetical protein
VWTVCRTGSWCQRRATQDTTSYILARPSRLPSCSSRTSKSIHVRLRPKLPTKPPAARALAAERTEKVGYSIQNSEPWPREQPCRLVGEDADIERDGEEAPQQGRQSLLVRLKLLGVILRCDRTSAAWEGPCAAYSPCLVGTAAACNVSYWWTGFRVGVLGDLQRYMYILVLR